MFEERLPCFRGGFAVNAGEAAGEIKRIFEAAAVGYFFDREAGSPEQSHGELEFEQAKCFHRRVAECCLKEAAEVFFCDACALGKFPELQGVMGICVDNRPHEIQ